MRPRNAFERKAMEIHPTLPPLTDAQKRYAFSHCFKHEALVRKKNSDEYICLECGHSFKASPSAGPLILSTVGDKVVCPHCGMELNVKLSPRRSASKKICETFQLITTAWEFQIVRNFYVFQTTMPGAEADYWMGEVSQIYQMPGRSTIVVARPRVGLCSCYSDIYRYDMPMSIKYNTDFYEFGATVVYPRQKVLPIITRNGYCKELKSYFPVETFRRLIGNPKYETLAKAKRFDIWFNLESYKISLYWEQIKMLIRHDYRPDDVTMWYDTLDIAKQLNLDIKSPKYVLPGDLKGMHDMLYKRLQKKRRAQEAARKREEMAKKKEYERLYKKHNAKLLTIVIVSGDITIKPLQNYKEFVAEGEAMHHCVENYWKRKESLILSARSGNTRIATIELDRSDFHVKQCRGVCNEVPKRYQEICNILESHKNDFVKATKSRRKAV